MAEVDPSAPSLELSRRFAAPPARVFDAWLGKAWGEWLPPAGASCVVAELNATVGGRYLVRMKMADGRNVEISGTYREIDRPRKLVLTWNGSYMKQEMLITVAFLADGGGTVMTLRQEGFPDTALRDAYKGGWGGPGGSLDKLATFLAKSRAEA